MFESKHRKTDIAFVMGLITAPYWCGAQAFKALTNLAGVSLAQYFAFVLSFFVGAVLANAARNKSIGDRRSITQQTVMLALWAVCGTLMVVFVISLGSYMWSPTDTLISVIATAGVSLTLLWALVARKPVSDAAVRAFLGVALKPIPQFLLIPKMFAETSGGYSIPAIVLGNVSIWTRIYLNIDSLQKEGVSRDKKWLLTAEILNGISWLAVSIVWLVR